MKTQAPRFLPALLLVALLATPAFAASDYLLELDGIKGESKDKAHPDTIEIESFSFGASNAGAPVGGGGGAGKVSFSDLSFSKALDKTSPLLYLRTANLAPIKKAVLFVRKAGDAQQRDYYTVTLTDVLVSSVQTSSRSGGSAPAESFKLSYGKIEFSYATQKADGSLDVPIKTGWDIKNNVPAP